MSSTLVWTRQDEFVSSSTAERSVIIEDDPQTPEQEAARERLLQRSLIASGFDWDALARVNRDGWGLSEDE